MSIANFGIENVTHQCQDCGMKFYNSHELVNHMKKFCLASGLNSLQGLAQYENKGSFSKNLKNYGANSLGAMKYQPEYNASQLAKQARSIQRHKEQLSVNRQYSNTNANKNKYDEYTLKNQTDQGVYQKSIVNKFKPDERVNSRVANGQRLLGASDISIHSLNNFGNQLGDNGQLHTKRSIQSINSDDQFHSPPTKISALPSKPFAKHYGPSVLEKSNSSIANMTLSQKKEYASDKLVELDNIADMYDQSGGMSMDFRKNLDKMRKFYRKMLEDDKPLGKYPGQFAQSRVQTPINKLRNVDVDENNFDPKRKNIQQDSLDYQINAKKNKKSKVQNENIKEGLSQSQKKNTDMLNNSPFSQMGQNYGGYPYFPTGQSFPYMQPTQPQIIMIPPYPQTQTQTQSGQISQQIKYLHKMLQMKNEENAKLMKMLMETKREKNKQVVKSRVQQIRQSRISSLHSQNNMNDNLYHMEQPTSPAPSTEQKILLALQRQQLDELRLLSSLPEQLQQIKMQSVMKIIEQRTQLQKQILEQKVRRLEEQKKNQLHEEQVRLDKDQWANRQRKKLIGHQMDDIINQYQRKVNGEDDEDEQEQQDPDAEDGDEVHGGQYPEE